MTSYADGRAPLTLHAGQSSSLLSKQTLGGTSFAAVPTDGLTERITPILKSFYSHAREFLHGFVVDQVESKAIKMQITRIWTSTLKFYLLHKQEGLLLICKNNCSHVFRVYCIFTPQVL